ncbi:YdcF family protein [Biostraticola tofi]|uniref:DUF218 domain-containing protein n=1 Tax=Biostraticola tofi TaxID=466109 RepID=A0A4R3YWC0_9GAMM|nr:ElyC/SanA/YdcF family protein [Biostraticola tofi]TCV96802.1 DUF218 domain-containing protein [Biostraticola tofi]
MVIEESIIRDINTIARWLAADELPGAGSVDPQLIILAGHAVVPGILGVMKLAAETDVPVLFTGGVGHSTHLLKQGLNENPLTRSRVFEQQSEADIFYSIATDIFAISPSRLYVEDRSTNSGQNADYSRELITRKGLNAERILLSQDPLMQRRTRETFELSWRTKALAARFINCPVLVPQLVMLAGKVMITGVQSAGHWTIERFIEMALGEMERLRDGPDGYGPLGKGFIGHVAIPAAVMSAWEHIESDNCYAALKRSQRTTPNRH